MIKIHNIVTDIDPLDFIKMGSTHDDEYQIVSQKIYDTYINKNKIFKFEVFEIFQNVYWQGACSDELCTQITDLINQL